MHSASAVKVLEECLKMEAAGRPRPSPWQPPSELLLLPSSFAPAVRSRLRRLYFCGGGRIALKQEVHFR